MLIEVFNALNIENLITIEIGKRITHYTKFMPKKNFPR